MLPLPNGSRVMEVKSGFLSGGLRVCMCNCVKNTQRFTSPELIKIEYTKFYTQYQINVQIIFLGLVKN